MPEPGDHADALFRVLDELAAGCACFSISGILVRESPALRRTLTDHAEAGRMREAASALARLVGGEGRRHAGESRSASAARALDTADGRYQLAASTLPPGLAAHEQTVIVVYTRAAAPRPPADLARQYRLTPREVEIAHLIAAGNTNKGIADRLQLSVRTVHHHAARVLRKLGVPRRAAVAARLSGRGQ